MGVANTGARHSNLAWQSGTDQAEAPVLAQQNKGLRVFHEANRNHWQEQWQALAKNRDIFSSLPFFQFFIARFPALTASYC
ncbi:hypothetical protein ALP92_103155 [Pseudomonas syringae pv. primulae]|uniref:Uncharacterized protein n=1 Tax=Pseudomonas syringae pv. primulae TaxID=251707 RepID=A0A3M4SJY1_9PSED|nr:hypothetical protein ALP92_103155 [Pseudomonas syringae pv. primulae]